MSCDKCNGRGHYTEINKNGEEIFVYCQCKDQDRKLKEYKRRLKESNIPSMYHLLRLSDYQKTNVYILNEPIVDKINKYCEKIDEMVSNGIGFYIFSQVHSSGKTTLLTYVGKRFLAKHYEIYYITLSDLYNELVKSLTVDKMFVNESIEKCKVLLIDDFDKFNGNYEKWLRIYQLLNKFFNDGKIIGITNNSDIEDIEDENITSLFKKHLIEFQIFGTIEFDLYKKLED